MCVRPALRPRWDLRAWPKQRLGVAVEITDVAGSHDDCISGLHHTARALAVYASPGGSPPLPMSGTRRKTRFRPVANRYRAGLGTRWVALRGFKVALSPPLPGFAWRNCRCRLRHRVESWLGHRWIDLRIDASWRIGRAIPANDQRRDGVTADDRTDGGNGIKKGHRLALTVVVRRFHDSGFGRVVRPWYFDPL